MRFKGIPIVLCRKEKRTLAYDPTTFLEVTDVFQPYQQIVNTAGIDDLEARPGQGGRRKMKRDALIDGPYRYWLTREWDAEKPRVLFVMLNPSTGDHEEDDNTIKRCVGFAKRWCCVF